MPIYIYEEVESDGTSGERFELKQSINDDSLKTHPLTGKPVRRVIQPPNLSTKYTPKQTKSRTENSRLEKAGFTKYERDKLTGKYHRITGKEGPKVIDANHLKKESGL